jgi:hypothetical protein
MISSYRLDHVVIFVSYLMISSCMLNDVIMTFDWLRRVLNEIITGIIFFAMWYLLSNVDLSVSVCFPSHI